MLNFDETLLEFRRFARKCRQNLQWTFIRTFGKFEIKFPELGLGIAPNLTSEMRAAQAEEKGRLLEERHAEERRRKADFERRQRAQNYVFSNSELERIFYIFY